MNDSSDEQSTLDEGLPLLPRDWPQQATQRLVTLVDTVSRKTTGPAIRISRAVVYGFVAVILLLLALPLVIMGLTRWLIDSIDSGFLWFLPDVQHDKAVWIAYLALGVVFNLIGLILWSLRPRGAAKPAPSP